MTDLTGHDDAEAEAEADDADAGESVRDADADPLSQVLAALGPRSTAEVWIYRRRRDGRDSFCAAYSPDDCSVADIREQWGGGRYLARPWDTERKQWLRGARTFYIEGPARADGDAKRNGAQMADRIADAVAARTAPAGGAGLSDVLQLVELVKALQPPPQPAPDPEAMMKLFFRGMREAERMREPPPYEPILRRLDPMLDWLTRQPHDRKAAPAEAGIVPAKPSPLALLAPQMPRLLALAAQGADPVTWAAAIAVAPQAAQALDTLAAITDRLGDVGILDELCATFPQAAPHRAWFGQLLGELLVREDGAE